MRMNVDWQSRAFSSVSKAKNAILCPTVEIYKHIGLAQEYTRPEQNHSTPILQELHH